MVNNLSFDDVAKKLLIFLNDQIPLLESKTDKEEILKQIQVISFTIRAHIVQLEGASTAQVSDVSNNNNEVMKQIENLKKQIVQTEELLNIERNNSRELREKYIRNSLDDLNEEEKSNFEDFFHKQLIEIDQLRKDNQKLKNESERYKIEYEKYRAEHDKLKLKIETDSLLPKVDESVVLNLKAELAEIENNLNESETNVSNLKQALQNKEIELNKSKEAILDAINHEKKEVDKYRAKIESLESVKSENETLKKQVSDLQNDLLLLPTKEEFQNNMVSMTTKLKFLEESLFNSQTELKKAQDKLSEESHSGIQKEKEELEQKVASLELTIRNLVTARETEATNQKNSFLFNPDECIFLFETLSATVRRLSESLENKDIYLRSKESITILEKNKSITKIQTVGYKMDTRLHKITKAFIADFLPDETIIYEEAPGFVSGNKLIQKAVVWIAKSEFVCSECGKVSKPYELFCPQCGYELTAADGTTKRDMPAYPTSLEVNLPLLDEMMRQGNVKASTQIMAIISKISPNNPEVVKKQAILSRADSNFSIYPTY